MSIVLHIWTPITLLREVSYSENYDIGLLINKNPSASTVNWAILTYKFLIVVVDLIVYMYNHRRQVKYLNNGVI